ncbi:MAG: CRISPR-associated endoribonuclease Cas6 [Bacteroidales bacterium]|nr:CRISPR-associated endoribonuclease Cas6 [Bacteroidales bacterium]
MRFRLTLTINKGSRNSNLLPLNYQYEFSSWIYHTIHYGNKEFADWLHEQGYTKNGKKFKLFTFSNVDVPEYKIVGDRLNILCNEVCLYVSFYPIEALEHFISGLFRNQEFTIGDKKSRVAFYVKTVEKIVEPEFYDEMTFKSLSPILVSYKKNSEKKYAEYLLPEGEKYKELFLNNLLVKYNSYNTDLDMINMIYNMDILSKPKSRLITIKANTPHESKLRGYLFDFKINAPAEIVKLGYYAGFGEKNSLGFGCCEVNERMKHF